MSTRPSLAGRAVLALVLMFGFYVLAISMAALLLYIPYAEWAFAGRLHIRLAIFCVVGAGVILWSMLPRIDRFDAPGPLLTASEHPKLFTTIRDIAKSTGQTMPAEVYAVPEVNAWVAQRGGIMGFGSRRVMGLGLPLLQTVTVDQFRAILVHEFGHYFGSDTKLGPWVHKTRSALFRTYYALAEHSPIMHKPFEWYAIALSLARKGWSVEALPGDAVRVRGEGQVFETFLMTQEIVEGKNVENWIAACQSAGIADVGLVDHE